MTTHRLTIKEVNRSHPLATVAPTDFTWEAGEEISADEVRRDPSFTHYCFDPENDAVIFVESDDPAAVDRAPFFYQGQIEHAVGLVSMPMEIFRLVAQEIPLPPKGLIIVHSVGRCGSTLLSKALETAPGVRSVSEPDDLTQLLGLWFADDSRRESYRELLISSIRWRGKPGIDGAPHRLAIKTRSEVLALADLFGSVFPTAKHFFLYRNAVSWMGSVIRNFPVDRDIYDAENSRHMEASWRRILPLIGEYVREDLPLNPVQIRMLAWITCMEGYLRLRDMGVPLAAARFEDLTAEPIPILRQFFAFCGIDEVDWTAVADVLGRDSQAGTIFDREERRKLTRKLTDDLTRDIHELIATRPLLGAADIRLPGDLSARLKTPPSSASGSR